MNKPVATKLGFPIWRVLVLSFGILALVGCGQETETELAATAVPVQTPTQAAIDPSTHVTPVTAVPVQAPTQAAIDPPSPASPVPEVAPDRTPDSSASTLPSQLPSPTPIIKDTVAAPAATPVPEFEGRPLPPPIGPIFELLSPANNTVSEVGVTRALGKAEPGAWAIVNGSRVVTGAEGNFQFDLQLDEGPNTIEVTVASAGGRTQTRTRVVSFIPGDSALPFSLIYPLDGVETRQPSIPVFGATRPDAVVAINGNPVDVGATGIFGGRSDLEEGANLVEVIATDIDGNVRSGIIAVFYIP